METAWESELAGLLNDLVAVQEELIDALIQKRKSLIESDCEGLAATSQHEQDLVERLQGCLQRREDLLALAADEGLPSESIQSLTASLPRSRREELGSQVKLAKARARLLQHHSLTNWVLAQRSLVHLSQLLEIIATGGRMQPTYGKDQSAFDRGALVDQEA